MKRAIWILLVMVFVAGLSPLTKGEAVSAGEPISISQNDDPFDDVGPRERLPDNTWFNLTALLILTFVLSAVLWFSVPALKRAIKRK